MAPLAKVQIFDSSHALARARQFSAGICLTVFFPTFVNGGLLLWEHRPVRLGACEWEFWSGVSQLVLAGVMYGCARQLLRNGRFTRLWLLTGILFVMIALPHAGYSAWFGATELRRNPITDWLTRWFARPNSGYSWGYELKQLLHGLPWACALSVTWWLDRRPESRQWSRMQPWALVAIAWCLGQVPALWQSSELWMELMCYVPYDQVLDPPFWLGCLLTVGSAVSLFLGDRSRHVVLALATVLVARPIVEALTVSCLVGVAQNALYISVLRGRSIGFTAPHMYWFDCSLFNRDLFLVASVHSILLAGPWLLIARYIRKHPARLPADDGSPWPRRYCGSCMYNLHGIESAVCPECGRQLIKTG